ncbi:MAG: F0F1 ATP synthase subunit gamma [Streptosporangiales bacterium]|nr:F0F1 ATP synthase subunit gamma [Streptosporangiales bacterium]
MGAQLRVIRGRIRSARAMGKITHAQELIASSRIITAQRRAAASAPYAREITRAVSALISYHPDIDHPLLVERSDARRAAMLLLTSDGGFCGGFNANLLREGEALAAKLRDEGKEPVIYVAGRKGIGWYRFRGRDIEREWSGFSGNPSYDRAEQIGQALVAAFSRPEEDGGVGEIHVVYTEFVSMLSQRPVIHRIVPLEVEEVEEGQETGEAGEAAAGGALPLYEFEPSPEEVLDRLLPSYIENRIWHMLLQSAASEHAARQRAMKSATDNANELVETLTRQANQARQAEITTEISEIVGGANALAAATAESE